MDIEIDKQVLSLSMRFYARALMYPYDELTHELQHVFREMEKCLTSDADNTLAAKALDVINFYQGEDMITLQSEFVRLFTPRDEQSPFISLHIQDLNPEVPIKELLRKLEEDPLFAEMGDEPELAPYIMEHFSSMLEYDEDERIEAFYETYLKTSLNKLAKEIYDGTTLNFYKEFAKGLDELVQLVG